MFHVWIVLNIANTVSEPVGTIYHWMLTAIRVLFAHKVERSFEETNDDSYCCNGVAGAVVIPNSTVKSRPESVLREASRKHVVTIHAQIASRVAWRPQRPQQ